MKNSVSKVNAMNNLTIGFLENNLKLEGMQITEEEKLICMWEVRYYSYRSLLYMQIEKKEIWLFNIGI